jgi:xanthine/uracil permease
MIVAGFVKVFGTAWISKLLPPVLVGAVVIVIGLGLSATAVKMCLYPFADPANGIHLTYLLVGGTPSTTYAENIGVMAVTRVYATQLFWWAGGLAFVIGGFVPKVSAVISSIPSPVMGGISLLLFGLIASSGLRLLVNSGIDYAHSRNLIMSSVVLVIGIGMETGGYTIPLGDYTIPGMALATVIGIVLNVILPKESEGLAVDSPNFVGDIQEDPALRGEA